MGTGSSREAPEYPEQQNHDDGLFSEAAMARRADKIRQMFPIATPTDDASSPDYTAFISPGAFAHPLHSAKMKEALMASYRFPSIADRVTSRINRESCEPFRQSLNQESALDL